MNTLCRALLTLTIIILFINNIQAQRRYFTRLTAKDGLSHSICKSVVQDRQGIIWISTDNGLNRFDGKSIAVYYGPGNRSVNKMLPEHDTLWVSNESGLNKFNIAKETWESLKLKDDNGNLMGVATFGNTVRDRQGRLWVASTHGLAFVDRLKKEMRLIPQSVKGLSEVKVNSVALAGDHLLLLASQREISLFDTEKMKNIVLTHGTQNTPIEGGSALLLDDQIIWICSGDKFRAYDLHTHTDREIPFYLPDGTKIHTFNVVRKTPQGTLLIGADNGLVEYNPKNGSYQIFIHDPADISSISSSAVRDVFIDNSGLIWFATLKGGVSRLDNWQYGFNTLTFNAEQKKLFDDNDFWGIYKDRNNNLWLGSWNKGICRIDGKSGEMKFIRNNPANEKSLITNRINTFIQDRQGYIWAGSWAWGLNKLDGQGNYIKRYWPQNGDPNPVQDWTFRSMTLDADSNLWIAGWGAILHKYDHTTDGFTAYDIAAYSGIKKGQTLSVWNIQFDHKGQVYIGTNGEGLLVFDPATERISLALQHKPDDPNSLSSNIIRDIHFSDTNTVWFATEFGLDRYEISSKKIKRYNTSNGLSDACIIAIYPDTQGNLWVITETRGINCLNIKTGEIRYFGKENGLAGDEYNYNVHFQTPEGTIYLGGPGGLSWFHPDSIRQNNYTPSIVISGLSILGQEIKAGDTLRGKIPLNRALNHTDTLTLYYRDKLFTLSFASLDYKAPEKTKYAYFLEGFDEDWHYTDGRNPVATYANLPGGTYRFRLRATNCDQVWNKNEKILIIKIIPPFWRTWWFYTLTGLLSLGLTVLFIRLRERQLRNDKKQLEERIALAKAALDKKMSEVEQYEEEIRTRDKEEIAQRWTNSSMAHFSELLSRQKGDSDALARKLIAELIPHIGAEQGTIYLAEKNDTEEEVLILKSFYAPDKQHLEKTHILPGEGLIGTCYEQREAILIDNLPPDYATVASGLGELHPRHLLIVPLMQEELLCGTLEILSYHQLEDYKIAFVKKLAENMANIITMSANAKRMALLYEKANQMAEELTSQEEELRQNLEEMRTTQDHFIQKEAKYKEREKNLLRLKRDYEKQLADFKKHDDPTTILPNDTETT